MKKKKPTGKIKYIKPEMRFNPGTQKYEPILATKKGKPKINIDWFWIMIIILLAICILIWRIMF
ncbi:MAG: hypothetical protein Q8P15_01920 [Nanoarchaeota archaeon]|nr:hypothetical protein [Nanoarchaeota archaeon]